MRKIFYSFHFDNDVMRVQLIRNIGAIDGNLPITPQAWESLRAQGPTAIEHWIRENMFGKSCVVVLIGKETAFRPWVKYEIIKGWNDKKGVLGIYIHNIKCARNGIGIKGPNPFDFVLLSDGRKMSSVVKCYNPDPYDAYNDIAANIESWIDSAITSQRR